MITIKLCGGLGNQLFQYAYGYQLAKKVNTELYLDLSWFEKQNLREPDILKLDIKYDRLVRTWDESVLIKIMNITWINRALRLPGFVGYRLPNFFYLKEARYKYSSKIENFKKNNVYVDGYWQCPIYFDKEYVDLISLFTIKNLRKNIYELGEKLKTTQSIAIHVRRGDYPKKKQLGVRLLAIGNTYYKSAINDIISKYPEAEIYLFSNEIKDSKVMVEDIVGKKVNVLSEKIKLTALEEWYLMSCCQHQIIGNSTFSWWSAYLNQNENKMVYAPNNYWGNDDICPKEWIKIGV